jgi:ATP-dependent phosphoenolpyruvate carboxykinase
LASCRAEAFGVVPPVTTHGQPHAVRSTRTATIVAALADREVEWAFDAELGLQVAAAVPGVAENEPLWPRQRFERVGLIREYAERIAELRGEWRAYLAGFQGLDEDLVAAFG